MAKPTLATVALGGCEGCHVSLFDAHEGLLDLLEVVDLVNTPYTGPDDLPDHVDVVLVEGPVETDADLEHLRRARQVAGTLVAMGSCAVLGGIGGLRNLVDRQDVLETAFGAAGAAEKSGDGLPQAQAPLSTDRGLRRSRLHGSRLCARDQEPAGMRDGSGGRRSVRPAETQPVRRVPAGEGQTAPPLARSSSPTTSSR